MKIILSPAKQMKIELGHPYTSFPTFKHKADELYRYLIHLNFDELKAVYKASDKVSKEGQFYLSNYENKELISPAIYSYDGIAFTYMEVSDLNEESINFLNRHLLILSGLYGVLKPLDGIHRYRLEMGSKIHNGKYKNLYDFWQDLLYQEVYKDHDIILNLASAEYASIIRKYLKNKDIFIDVMFYENENNKLVEKGVYCKMARGSLVKYIAENKIDNIEDIKKFNKMNYSYSNELSSKDKIVFIRGKKDVNY